MIYRYIFLMIFEYYKAIYGHSVVLLFNKGVCKVEIQQYSILSQRSDVIIHLFFTLMGNKSKKVQFHKDAKRRRIRKSLSERIKRLNKKENHYRTCLDEPVEAGLALQPSEVKVQHKNKVFIKRGMLNFVQSLNSRIRNKVNFLLFGMIYFDEDGLKSTNKDRSLLKSMFNFYSINFVKITEAFLILKIQLNFENTYPVGYIIERFKSEGRREFLQLALMLEKIYNRFVSFQGMKTPSLYDHQIDKELQKSKGKPCMLMISPNVIAFSKELIEISGFSMEFIANSCLLNRSFLFDLFLSDNYLEEVTSYISRFDLNGKLRKGQITQDQYRLESSYHSQTSIIDKSNNRIMVKTKRSNLQPGVACWQVQKVIGKQKLLQYIHLPEDSQRIKFERLRKQKDLKQINNLINSSVEKSEISKEKTTNVCGYKSIEGVKKQHD